MALLHEQDGSDQSYRQQAATDDVRAEYDLVHHGTILTLVVGSNATTKGVPWHVQFVPEYIKFKFRPSFRITLMSVNLVFWMILSFAAVCVVIGYLMKRET